MVRILDIAPTQSSLKDYEDIIQELFIDMFQTVKDREIATIHNKISSERKVFKGLINDLKDLDMSQELTAVEEPETADVASTTTEDPKRLARTILKKKMVAYFAKVAQANKDKSERFWKGYAQYETLIKKCFNYIYGRKFPNYNREDEQETYNDLLITLENLDIFNKFDPTKCFKRAIPLEKRFEQFMYKWTESFLSRSYNERKVRTNRFRRTSATNDIHTGSFVSNYVTKSEPSETYIQLDLLSSKQKSTEYKLKAKAHKEAVAYHVSDPQEEPITSVEDDLVEADLWSGILGSCKSDMERQIVTLRKEGSNNEEIAAVIGYTKQYVSLILDKIKDRFNKNNLIAA